MEWYTPWLQMQIRDSGLSWLTLLEFLDEVESDQSQLEKLCSVWVEVAKYLHDSPASIDDIVKRLCLEGTIKMDMEASDKDRQMEAARSLVFALIGWQTLLYLPDIGSTPSSILAIDNDTDGYQCASRLSLKQEHSMCRRPLVECLNGFGVLLPPSGFVLDSSDTGQASSTSPAVSRTIEPSSFNAFLLSSVTKTRIKWVESLSCHLEFDEGANVLFLFRFPSFCAMNLLGQGAHEKTRSPLRACAKSIGKSNQWATVDEVDQLLLEILISYRFLFGQTKQGRQLYRKIKLSSECTSADIGEPVKKDVSSSDAQKTGPRLGYCSANIEDPLLTDLCSRKHCNYSFVLDNQRDAYDTGRDLVILKSRVVNLQRYLSQKKPRTWRELWHDKRDSAQWFTFWAVLMIGGLGVVLAFMQVVLQAIELGITR
ncbi:MAG: hypothetical protein M1831_001141 [Alyxoria varia]|nr:MAG: hypothetical protein M1831_001141 [Alyxoria varia]